MSEKVNDKGMVRVFVYGTLKRGHCNNVLLSQKDAHFLGYDTIREKLALADLGAFPAVVPDDDHQTIYGETYAIDEETLEDLDWLEGHPAFYTRRKVRTKTLDKRAWVYVMEDISITGVEDYIPEGTWRPRPAEDAFWKEHSMQQVW